MTAGDLSFENETCFYEYRGKGGKTGRRELPRPAVEALRSGLSAYGKDSGVMGPRGVALALSGGHRRGRAPERHFLIAPP